MLLEYYKYIFISDVCLCTSELWTLSSRVYRIRYPLRSSVFLFPLSRHPVASKRRCSSRWLPFPSRHRSSPPPSSTRGPPASRWPSDCLTGIGGKRSGKLSSIDPEWISRYFDPPPSLKPSAPTGTTPPHLHPPPPVCRLTFRPMLSGIYTQTSSFIGREGSVVSSHLLFRRLLFCFVPTLELPFKVKMIEHTV